MNDILQYDAWGTETSGITTGFGYTGRWGGFTDSRLGRVLNWNRWYGPKVGRWGSRDPIGMKGGPNLFAYVRNNPNVWTDPEGLMPWDIQAARDCIRDSYQHLKHPSLLYADVQDDDADKEAYYANGWFTPPQIHIKKKFYDKELTKSQFWNLVKTILHETLHHNRQDEADDDQKEIGSKHWKLDQDAAAMTNCIIKECEAKRDAFLKQMGRQGGF
jgi:RHS repeat-associated protein